jgi:GrpB-like predicted nucleotidyltransferase (UPF0157 family)
MIEIVEYRPDWVGEFRAIAQPIRGVLGELALRIDHIGSTSIPGLCAKDTIDLQITVAALDPRVTAAMGKLGYTRREDISRDHRPPDDDSPEEDWEKYFFRAPAGQRRTNTHVRVLGRPNQRYALLFRDYLVAHPTTAAAYGELKRRLAVSLAEREDDYPEVKDPAVDLIYLPAQRWAAETHWTQRRSDA